MKFEEYRIYLRFILARFVNITLLYPIEFNEYINVK